jgi:hypothetical protein
MFHRLVISQKKIKAMKTNRTFSNAFSVLFVLVGMVIASCQSAKVASTESDDLYFNSQDKLRVKYASDVAVASNRTGNNGSLNHYDQSANGGGQQQEATPAPQANEAADYYNPTYQMSAPMVNGTNRQSTLGGGDTYITNNYHDSWARQSFPGWGFQPVLGFATFSPWGWGYNPWFSPRFRGGWGRPGWNISIGYGWGMPGMGMGWGMPGMGMGGFGYNPFWGCDPFWGCGMGMGMGYGWGMGYGMGFGRGMYGYGYDPFFNPYFQNGNGWGGNNSQTSTANLNRNPTVVGPRGRMGNNSVTGVSTVGSSGNTSMPSRQQLVTGGGNTTPSAEGGGRIPATSRPPSRNEVSTSNYSFSETTVPSRGNQETISNTGIGGRETLKPNVPKQYESGTTPSTYSNTKPAREVSTPSPRRGDAGSSGYSVNPAPSRDNSSGSSNYYQRERSQMRNTEVIAPTRESRSNNSSRNWSTPSSGSSFGTRDRSSSSYSAPSTPSRSTYSSPSPSPRMSSPSPSSGGGRGSFGGSGGSRTPSRPR